MHHRPYLDLFASHLEKQLDRTLLAPRLVRSGICRKRVPLNYLFPPTIPAGPLFLEFPASHQSHVVNLT
jgi:hypothetical protein